MGVPVAASRLWRDRPRVVALGLLALTALAASGLQSTAALVLQQTLDENWRGTYDILVTQRDKDPVIEGLLHSESLVDATSGRLSLADLALIRGLPGVEVAAPVAQVAYSDTSAAGDPRLWLPIPVRSDASLESPQAFRVTVESTTTDGIAERALAPQTVLAFAYQPSYSQIVFDSSGAPLTDENGDTVYATEALADSPRLLSADNRVRFTGSDYDAQTQTIALGLIVDPRPAANIVLVDPVAERELLGDAGAFLDPLVAATDPFALVALDREPTPINLTVRVEEFTDITPGVAGAEAVQQAQGTGFLQNGQIAPRIPDATATTLVGEYTVNVADAVAPYDPGLALLGDVPEEAVAAARSALTAIPVARAVLHGRYVVAADGAPVTLRARAYVAAYDTYSEAPVSNGAPAGSVTEYSKLYGAVGSAQSTQSAQEPGEFDVVGTFGVDELRASVGPTSFAPLGAYDIANPSVDGAALATSITGFGVPGSNDVAIGSFAMLEGAGVDRPISSIRIRVAGIDAYTPEAQQRLLTAASGLQTLGFTATIVAGSSPQKLPVLVADYATAEVNELGQQVIGDLGIVQQDWSRLGAVVEADAAVSATSVALLATCVVAVGLLLSVVQFASIPGRRANAAVLRQLGWRRARIARWLVAEELVGLVAISVVGALAVMLATVPLVASVAVGVSVLLVAVTSAFAVIAGARAPRATVRRQRALAPDHEPRVTTPAALGVRIARRPIAHSLSLAVAVLLVTVSVAIGVAVFVQGRELAGPSELGAVASARAWIPQGLLAVVTLAAGITLAVLSRRMALERRRDEWVAIRAMGWARSDVTRAQLAELAVSAVPGALVGVAASAFVAAQVPGILPAVLISSGVAGCLAVAVVLASGRKLD